MECRTKTASPYDGLFKDIMAELFEELGTQVITEQEVSRQPRAIDVVVTCTRTDIEKVARETTFNFFLTNNLIEFKSPGDPLNIWDYHKILARAHFYIAEKKITTPSTVVCIICSSTPRKVLYELPDEVRFTKVENWHYLSSDMLKVHVVIIDELAIEYKNYPLLLFAKIRKFREFLKHAFEHNRLEYLKYAYTLRPQETEEVLMMLGKRFKMSDEARRRMIENLFGIEEVVKLLSPEDRVRGLSVEDILHVYDIEDILRGLDVENRLRGLDVEDIIRGLSQENIKKLQKILNGKEGNDNDG